MPEQLLGDNTVLAPGTRKGPEDSTLLSEHKSLQTTGTAPPFRAPLHPVRPGLLTGMPAPGECLGDFELLSVLGTGSFAQVFLARQGSLNRLVALKASANDRQEGLTMARLEHDHIVQVFSEGVDRGRNLRLLCMQFVPGTTLERIIRALSRHDRRTWDGRTLLAAIDTFSTHPASLDPAALRDREFLAGCDFVEAVCWLGARLAEALAHAHSLGVLHRDIKPANILLNCYGRPLLADFNVAFAPHRPAASVPQQDGQRLGGTLAYMAPEHLDAFDPQGHTPPEAVDQRSDIYSLGVVLYELLSGRLPCAAPIQGSGPGAVVRELAAQRRAAPPSLRPAGVPAVLDQVISRCLEPDPARRYQTAADLVQALEGCRELRRADREMPSGSLLTSAALARPFLMLAVLMLLPHFLGSLVNISYNQLRIVSTLSPAQQSAFTGLVPAYNLIVYPVCLGLLYALIAPIYRTWGRLSQPGFVDPAEVRAARLRALRLPPAVVGVACLGWLPGGLLFPLGLFLLAGPVGPDVFWHFLISFTLSGLIALTYSLFAVQFVVLRVLYPRLWADPAALRSTTGQELRPVAGRLQLSQLLAVLIPLAGAVLMVGVGPEQFTPAAYCTFRLLVTTLMSLGMLGLGVALLASASLTQVLAALGGPARGRSPLPANL